MALAVAAGAAVDVMHAVPKVVFALKLAMQLQDAVSHVYTRSASLFVRIHGYQTFFSNLARVCCLRCSRLRVEHVCGAAAVQWRSQSAWLALHAAGVRCKCPHARHVTVVSLVCVTCHSGT